METKTVKKQKHKTQKEQNLTQKQLAEKIGYTQQTIADWEAGNIRPTSDAIIALCKALEVSADYLLGLSDN